MMALALVSSRRAWSPTGWHGAVAAWPAAAAAMPGRLQLQPVSSEGLENFDNSVTAICFPSFSLLILLLLSSDMTPGRLDRGQEAEHRSSLHASSSSIYQNCALEVRTLPTEV